MQKVHEGVQRQWTNWKKRKAATKDTEDKRVIKKLQNKTHVPSVLSILYAARLSANSPRFTSPSEPAAPWEVEVPTELLSSAWPVRKSVNANCMRWGWHEMVIKTLSEK